MFVTKYFLIGKVSIASSWVALIFSFILAYSVVRWKYGKSSADLLSDAIFYFIIVWKLSVVLTDFKTVIQFPLSIIYFHGGTTGVLLGIIAAAVKVFWEIKRKQLTNPQMMGLLLGTVWILSMYQVFIVLVNEGPVLIRFMTGIVFSVFGLVILLFIKQFEKLPYQLMMLMVVLHLFMSALQPAGLIQTPMFVAISLGIVLAMLVYFQEKNDVEAMH